MQNDQNRPLPYFWSQPHQPFFVLGIVGSILFMLLFLLTYKGVLIPIIDPVAFHAYSLIFIVFTSFFQGFLLTTFPRFSQIPELTEQLYLTNFTLMATGSLLFLAGAFTTLWILIPGVILLMLGQLYSFALFWQIYRASPVPDLHDQFWILMGFGAGIEANLLYGLYFLFKAQILFTFANLSGVYLFLIITSFAVAQRMIPFFSHIMIERNNRLLPTLFALFLLKVLFDSFGLKVGFLFTLTAGILLAREIYFRWKIPFAKGVPILWILHLSLYWLPAALIVGSVSEIAELIFAKDFLFLQIHLIVLGFLTTVLIGFGTRVTLGHSGNLMQINSYTKFLFYLTQIVVYFRGLYSLGGWSMVFDITVALWLLLFILWSVRYLPVLVTGKRLK